MARWDPDARVRLQKAAVGLYLERGYQDVTVAEIARNVGLTRRTFFRHFPDKAEVLFAGLGELQVGVLERIGGAETGTPAIDVVVTALAGSGDLLEGYMAHGVARRDLIASATALQERELMKMAALATAIAEALRDRGTEAREAELVARAGVMVFTAAFDRWVDDPAADFWVLVQRSLTVLLRGLGAPVP